MRIPIIVIATFALVVAACSGVNSGQAPVTTAAPAQQAQQGPLTITLDDFTFTPDTLTVQAGQEITVTLVNLGAVEHELMIGRQRAEEGGYLEDLLGQMSPEVISGHGYKLEIAEMEEEHESEAHMGSEVELEPGGEVTLRLQVPESSTGEWEMGCFVTGHYEAGMKGTLQVVGS